MNKTIMEALNNVKVVDLIGALILIGALAILLLTQKKKIMGLLNKWRKTKNEEEDFKQTVATLTTTVSQLSQKMVTYEQNREHDRADSRKIQKEIYEAIDKQKEGIQELKEITLSIQEKNSKTTRAGIKEKIERIYRECHPVQACTETQYETLKDLIEEYEEHGGKNSFVHSLVEPEMVNWKRIPIVKSVMTESEG